MEHDVTQSAYFYRLWAWFETNRRQVLWGTIIVIIAGLAVAYFLWTQGEKEATAGEALSNALTAQALSGTPRKDAAAALRKVATDHAGTSAGGRALLYAAANLFSEGQYAEAQADFQRFIRQYADSPFMGQALLGVAVCWDAQGKTNEAEAAYRDLIDHHPSEVTVPQAKFDLAQIYQSQNRIDQALSLYEEVTRAYPYGSVGSEAGIRAEELKLKQPKPAPAPSPAPVMITPSVSIPSTNNP